MFQRLIHDFPDHKLVPNAYYWIAASYRRQGKLLKAMKFYDVVISKYPRSVKTPDAYLMKGKTLLKLKRAKEGLKTLDRLIKLFPRTEAAGKAGKIPGTVK